MQFFAEKNEKVKKYKRVKVKIMRSDEGLQKRRGHKKGRQNEHRVVRIDEQK